MSTSFSHRFSFSKRKLESQRVLSRYNDRIPVICEKAPSQPLSLPQIDKEKYLVPSDLTMGQFMYVIRKRLKLPSEQALYFVIGGEIPSQSELITFYYDNKQNKDGFLYVQYLSENTFGEHIFTP
jgi:GABA(A) receptor-associated protein